MSRFGLAVVCGAYLVAVAGPELMAVGAASILAGVLYTGGPRPYGYEGLGELFVFLFFGIVAVTGSYFVQVQELPWQAFVCAIPVGLLASAILVVNNVRDVDTDRRAGKRTLAVRLGRDRTRTLYTLMLTGAFLTAPLPWLLGSMSAWLLLCWAVIPLAASLTKVIRTKVDGPSLNAALARTGMLQLLFCLLYCGRHPRERRHRIVRLTVKRRTLRLRRPLQGAYGTVGERVLLGVSITDREGASGFGEAAPLEPYDGVSVEQVERALERYGEVLAGAESMNGAQIVDACRAAASCRRRSRRSTSRCGTVPGAVRGSPSPPCLTDRPAADVPVNATLSALDRAGPPSRPRGGARGLLAA